jgi:hypothetical protein
VFAHRGIVEFKIEVLIEEEAEIRVLKELSLVAMLEMLKRGRSKNLRS